MTFYITRNTPLNGNFRSEGNPDNSTFHRMSESRALCHLLATLSVFVSFKKWGFFVLSRTMTLCAVARSAHGANNINRCCPSRFSDSDQMICCQLVWDVSCRSSLRARIFRGEWNAPFVPTTPRNEQRMRCPFFALDSEFAPSTALRGEMFSALRRWIRTEEAFSEERWNVFAVLLQVRLPLRDFVSYFLQPPTSTADPKLAGVKM